MEIFYSSVIIAAAVFVIIICIFSPVIEKNQKKQDRLEDIRRAGIKEKKKQGSSIGEFIGNTVKKAEERKTQRRIHQAENVYGGAGNAKAIKTLRDADFRMSYKTFMLIRLGIGAGFSSCLLLVILKTGMEYGPGMKIILALCAFGIGMIIPDFYIRRQANRRKLELVNSMPDTMDLLAISTTAGLGFDAAVMRIADYDNSPCIQELKLVMGDVQHGISKREAYLAMKERCGVREMTAFINAMLQAEELGVPISDVLMEQSATLRENRQLKAEEKVNKAPIKITIPLVLCIFPAMFIVLLGPAIMSLSEIL